MRVTAGGGGPAAHCWRWRARGAIDFQALGVMSPMEVAVVVVVMVVLLLVVVVVEVLVLVLVAVLLLVVRKERRGRCWGSSRILHLK